MADNVAITEGSGTTVATDDVSGVHYQKVKLAIGANDAANLLAVGAGAVDTGTPRMTLASDDPAVASLSVLDDWDRSDAAKVVGTTVIKDVTLTVSTSAYSGTKPLLLSDCVLVDGALRVTNGTGILQSITVIDEADQVFAADFYICSANADFGTINNASTISDNDAATILGIVSFATADFKDLGGVDVAHRSGLGIPISAVSGTDDIYVAAVLTSGSPTFAAATNVKLRLGILQD